MRIALCHLESLVCLPGVNSLFEEFGEQIGLVVLSRRFGPKHGGLWTQLRRGIRRSGWRMTLWLGFDIVSAQIVSAVESVTRLIGTRRRALASVRALSTRYGAAIVVATDVNADDTIEAVAAFAPDLIIVFNFDQILRTRLIEIAGLAVINVHPSLLPSFKGPCPVFWAMAQGCHEVGTSIHVITNAEIDAGPILLQEALTIDRSQSVGEVTALLFTAGANLLPTAVRQLVAGCPRPLMGRNSPGHYHTFPTPAEARRALKQGIRLCRAGFVLRMIAACFGLTSKGTT